MVDAGVRSVIRYAPFMIGYAPFTVHAFLAQQPTTVLSVQPGQLSASTVLAIWHAFWQRNRH